MGMSSSDNSKRIARSMRHLAKYLDNHSRLLLKNINITLPQVMCLDELREQGVMTVATLAHALHLSPSTTVGIIDRLEAKAFVKRTRSKADRRSVFIEITKAGLDFILANPNLLHNRLQTSLKELAQDEQKLIANSLDRIVQIIVQE